VIRGLPFELTDLEGKSLKKEDLKDKVLVIDIWGTWCPPCVMEIPHFVKLQEKYGKDGLQVVGLAYEKREPDENVRRRVATFARDRNINYPLLFPSPEMLALLNVSSFPTTLYLGRDGVVRKRVTGYADLGAMEETVKPLLAEKPAASPPTN
jgi:thiol-disulfide isomerase/thioredoxin